jgi:hypothetical protein
MALDFPVSPTLNQTYTSGNKTWIWNGTGWAANNTIGTTATLSGVETLSNKTLTAPLINGGILISPQEFWTVSATAATGTINFDVNTQAILYYTTNASANFTLNFRASSSATLSSILSVGDSVSVVFMNTNGTTAYYPTAFTIDGTSVTPKWQGGTAPTSGNASAIDAWSFEIVKTASTPTYQVFASQVKYA